MGGVFRNRDGLTIPYSEVLVNKKTKYQRLRILQTEKFGKILTLDDVMFQAEEGDELTEMATHLPLNVGPRKRRVLLVGGGDGFALKELVKHGYLERIDLVEIDPELLREAKRVFDFKSAWEDPRVRVFIRDGFAFLKNKKGMYDLIISTPANIYTEEGKENIAFPLFTREYFETVRDRLADDGIFVTDGSTAHYSEGVPNWLSIYHDLKTVFPVVMPYFFASKRMPGGSFVLLFASRRYHPVEDFEPNRKSLKTRYYNQAVHAASFALPEFLLRKMETNREHEE
jgi:spermidine synthase